MDLNHVPLFEALAKRMNWITQRQTVLAENVANSNTPGYVSKDLKEPDFSALLKKTTGNVTMAATQPNHIGGTKSSDAAMKPTEMVTDSSLDGNGVSVEAQMMKVSANSSDYALITGLYKQHLSLIKMVLGGGGGG